MDAFKQAFAWLFDGCMLLWGVFVFVALLGMIDPTLGMIGLVALCVLFLVRLWR